MPRRSRRPRRTNTTPCAAAGPRGERSRRGRLGCVIGAERQVWALRGRWNALAVGLGRELERSRRGMDRERRRGSRSRWLRGAAWRARTRRGESSTAVHARRMLLVPAQSVARPSRASSAGGPCGSSPRPVRARRDPAPRPSCRTVRSTRGSYCPRRRAPLGPRRGRLHRQSGERVVPVPSGVVSVETPVCARRGAPRARWKSSSCCARAVEARERCGAMESRAPHSKRSIRFANSSAHRARSFSTRVALQQPR